METKLGNLRFGMKIAYIYDAVHPWVKGGAEKRVYELSRRLAQRGHDVHCYGMRWWEGPDTILKEGVYLHGICKPMDLYSGGRRSIREALAFAWWVILSLERGYDLIDCQEFPILPCFSAKLVAKTGGSELFITWHEVWGDYWHEYMGAVGLVGRSIEAAASRLTDKNIAVSERTKRELEGMGVGGVRVVPNGIDLRLIQSIKTSQEASDIVFTGRLVGHKNVDLLIRALALVKQEVPELRAVIIGDGPEAMRLKQLALELGLKRHIEFTGFLERYDQAIGLMKASKVFVMPSAREGFGLAALEANACGLPVVTVDHRMNAVCDLVTDKTGLVCDLSLSSLAEAIIHALNKSENMRDACLELARGYDWDGICSHIEAIYRKGASQG